MSSPTDIPQIPAETAAGELAELALFREPPVAATAGTALPTSSQRHAPTAPGGEARLRQDAPRETRPPRRGTGIPPAWEAAARSAAVQQPARRPAEVFSLESEDDFWATVAQLRNAVAERMSRQRHEPGSDAERGAGLAVIDAVVREKSEELLQSVGEGWSRERQRALKKALHDAQFGLGRLQDLVDDTTIENIEVYGAQETIAIRTDGSQERVGPIARNENELRAMINDWATKQGKSFTPNRPRVRLALPGKARLTAVGYGHTVNGRTEVFIRLQRLRDITLAGLQHEGELDSLLADFLTAAVRARNTVVISGAGQGSGKSSLLRALALAGIPEHEKITTVETEFELYLDEYRSRVSAWQPITEAGEVEIDPADAIRDLLYDVQRSGADRVVVGEARGWEVMAMVRAMLSGNGSMTTIHADSAALVIEALVTLIAQYSNTSIEQARRTVAALVHLIVYLGVDIDPVTGKRFRYITEVLEVSHGDAGNEIATNQVFRPGPDGRAVPVGGVSDQLAADLRRGGFDPQLLSHYRGVGTWQERP